jgi:hypothetical protein
MDASVNPRLSDIPVCEFADRQGVGLRSRDINGTVPNSGSLNFDLIAPADAEVMIIDTTLEANPGQFWGNNPDNKGLGLFVAIRIPWSAIPGPTQFIIGSTYFANSTTPTDGYLYLGYAHLASVSPSITIRQSITRGTILGQSGDSGAAVGNHLDLTIFYIPQSGPRSSNPLPERTSLGPPGDPDGFNADSQYGFYNAFYKLFRNIDSFGKSVEIDPVILWPILDDNPLCNTPTATP